MASSTVENYLKCIFIEEQRNPGARVSTGRIAESLNVTPGTVTSMLKTLAKGGLLTYKPYRGVQLTPAGRQLATDVIRRHRLVELFLVKIMGLDWSEIHTEAELLEHAVSERMIQRIDEMLGHPAVDPHGDPIPTPEGQLEEPDLANLLHCPSKGWLEVARVTDQSKEFLQLLEKRGLVPGKRVQVTSRNEAADTVELVVQESRETVSLGFRAASKILVHPLSSAKPPRRAAGRQE